MTLLTVDNILFNIRTVVSCEYFAVNVLCCKIDNIYFKHVGSSRDHTMFVKE